jgi:hypothetical protein
MFIWQRLLDFGFCVEWLARQVGKSGNTTLCLSLGWIDLCMVFVVVGNFLDCANVVRDARDRCNYICFCCSKGRR